MKASNTSTDYEKPESELLNTFNSVEILEHAIQIADHRLSRAKQEGRNRVCSAG